MGDTGIDQWEGVCNEITTGKRTIGQRMVYKTLQRKTQ